MKPFRAGAVPRPHARHGTRRAPRVDAWSALKRRAATAIRRRREVRQRGAPDDVHDLRVATRRLQEVLDILAWALPDGARRRLRRRIRRIREALAAVRDADVQCELVEALGARLGAAGAGPLAPLRAQLHARAAAARAAEARDGAGIAVRGVGGRMRALLARAPEIPRGLLAGAARRALGERADQVAEAREQALRGRATALHALRIAVKKYRYTLEFMEEVGLGRHGRALDEARRLQEALGQLHDLDLLIDLARRVPGVDAPRLLALLRRERRPLQAAARAGVDAFHPKRPSRPPAPAEPPVGLLPGPDAIA